jgi:hypothetical protein
VRLTNLMGEMAHNGDTDLTEERVVEKFLRSMPKEVRTDRQFDRDAAGF